MRKDAFQVLSTVANTVVNDNPYLYKKTKLNVFAVKLDILRHRFRYGAGIENYLHFNLFLKNHRAKKSYIMGCQNLPLNKVFNSEEARKIFADKLIFNAVFKAYLKREYLSAAGASFNEIDEFIKKHRSVIVKPADSYSGQGVYIINNGSEEGKNRLRAEIESGKRYVIEELLKNSGALDTLFPSSLNTIRIVTFIDKESKVNIIKCVLRTGRGDSCVDNMDAGGLICDIDPTYGIVSGCARDRYNRNYLKHPDTGTTFPGFEIPAWHDVLDIIEPVCLTVPGARYVGWDIAVTDKGVAVIEGNTPSGEGIVQIFNTYGVRKELLSKL